VAKHRVVVIPGDGIGPEVVDAAREVLDTSGALLEWDVHLVGARALAGGAAGPVPESTLEAIRQHRVVLKGPLSMVETRAGARSPNVALRKSLDLYLQLRRFRALAGVRRAQPGLDLALARVMTEDLNEGIEYAAATARARELVAYADADGFDVDAEAAFSLKVMSASRVERASERACAWAEDQNVHTVTVAHKATIMRATDGLFLETARRVIARHAPLAFDDVLVDDLAAQLLRDPRRFDLVLTSNLYGDIVSSLAAGLVGGVGVVAGVTYGDSVAVFEAAHGTAPKYVGADRVNPCAAILAGVLMLRHLGEHRAAARVEHAVRDVVSSGEILTADLVDAGAPHVGTREMTRAILDRIVGHEKIS
jgi:isocitrate dehydrogenase (NAD+)